MASVAGRVNDYLEALAPVRFVSGREVECVVDTGFTGALVLPMARIVALGLPIFGRENRLQMVGGEETSAELALAQIEWLGEVKSVVVIAKDDYLIGTQLLDDARLVVDYRARTLAISRENSE